MTTLLKYAVSVLVILLIANFYFLSPISAETPCRSQGYCVDLQKFAAVANAQVPGLEFLQVPADAKPGDVLVAIYKLALGLVGISALIMIVWGGILYMSAMDNKGQMDTAKGYIWNAIYGIALALISWLILFTINPDIVGKLELNPSKITPVSPEAQKIIKQQGTDLAPIGTSMDAKTFNAEDQTGIKAFQKECQEKAVAAGKTGFAPEKLAGAGKINVICVFKH